jgi:hypothetical protein
MVTRRNRQVRRSKSVRRRRQKGGKQVAIYIGGVAFQGADVMIINYHYASPGIPFLVLFQASGASGILPSLGLPGGRCEDTHGTIEVTAQSELYEESRKAVYVDPEVFRDMTKKRNYVDIPGEDPKPGTTMVAGRRRVFICIMPFISTTIYDANKAILDADASTPHSFKETQAMIRIPLSDILKSIRADDDGRGRPVAVQGRQFYIQSNTMKAVIAALLVGSFEKLYHLGTTVHSVKKEESGEKTDTYKMQ